MNKKALLQTHFGSFSNEHLRIILPYFQKQTLQKKEMFLTPGKVCDKLSIIVSGILRIYTLVDGREITQWISTEDFLITDAKGFFFQQPNKWIIEAFTEVELLTITKTNYLKLCKEITQWNELEKKLILKCFAMMEERIFSHLSMTAEERYDLYFAQNKALFNQIPLQYIASVLGMTPETFSRIRKRKTKNP